MAQLWQISPSSSCCSPLACPLPHLQIRGGSINRFVFKNAPPTFHCVSGSSTPAFDGKHFPPTSPSSSASSVDTYGYVGGGGGNVSSTGAHGYVGTELGEDGGTGSGSGSHSGHGSGGGGGGSSGGGGLGGSAGDPVSKGSGLLGAFLKGWNDRVQTDPQFPFKVLMEEVVGVGACVIGDMASRPNFGLNELDFVFSTIVVGSILNFTLMYMLAPNSAAAAASSSMPAIFASCPPGHMFEQGSYSLLERLGTFVYKGTLFATVGFAAGLLGTFASNSLISMRKRIDPKSGQKNKAPPTILNAATWAIHMGLSSNLRYQAVNGLEFGLANVLSPTAFKASVLVTRMVNNVLGGMSFVALARLTGSQKSVDAPVPTSQLTQLLVDSQATMKGKDENFHNEESK